MLDDAGIIIGPIQHPEFVASARIMVACNTAWTLWKPSRTGYDILAGTPFGNVVAMLDMFMN